MSLIPNTIHVINNELDQSKIPPLCQKRLDLDPAKRWIPIRPDPDQQATLYLGVLLKGGRAEAGIATHCLMSIRSTSMAARSNMLWMKVPSRPSSCFCTATWSKIYNLRRGKEKRRGYMKGRLCTLYSRHKVGDRLFPTYGNASDGTGPEKKPSFIWIGTYSLWEVRGWGGGRTTNVTLRISLIFSVPLYSSCPNIHESRDKLHSVFIHTAESHPFRIYQQPIVHVGLGTYGWPTVQGRPRRPASGSTEVGGAIAIATPNVMRRWVDRSAAEEVRTVPNGKCFRGKENRRGYKKGRLCTLF